jgi:protein SCO1/2
MSRCDLPASSRLETATALPLPAMRHVALLACCVLAVAGCGSSAARPRISAGPPPKSKFAGAQLTPPRKAPAIALHDDAGRRVTLAQQEGRYVLVTFLYTHCPDVCPLIAQNLNGALHQLGAARDRVRVLAVSVDPVGDTPAAVRAFVRAHRLLPEFHYLIGTRAELRPVWNAWSVIAVQRKPKLVTHAAYTALVDPSGKERVLYDSRVTAAQVVHDLRLLMRA